MANTGYVIYQNLEEYNVDTNVATGNVKPNDPSDPDYVAPVEDLQACPVEEPELTNCVAIELTNDTQGDKTYSYTNCSGEFINTDSLGGFESVILCVKELNGEPDVSYETGISMSTGGSCT